MVSKINIMVIDDAYFDRLIAGKVIELAGVAKNCIILDSALKALDFFDSNLESPEAWPEIILLDISMPTMDGFAFLEEFKKFPDSILGKCKVVIVSSSTDPADIKKAGSQKYVSGFILKPLNHEKLLDALGF